MNEDWKDQIRPLPAKFGVGFTSPNALPMFVGSCYRYEQVGRHHNYYFTPRSHYWPSTSHRSGLVIDGFSPNLNKQLHVGHLRNLAVAASLDEILDCRFVALLGAALGVKKAALAGWDFWTDFVGYHPKVYYDVALPNDVVPTRKEEDDQFHSQGADVWDGPNGPIIVRRSDGTPLYAFHDLAFAAEVGPTHYITGHEQQEHFKSLGFGDKHLPMGLVLGDDGKKLKSRTGDAMLAEETLQTVADCLEDTPDRKKLAWNILAWNFLSPARETNIKFDAGRWSDHNAPGLYITYTYARIWKALGTYRTPHAPLDLLEPIDLELLGHTAYFDYYWRRASLLLDPSPLAQYAYDLAKVMTTAYGKERINGGRPSFRYAMERAGYALDETMKKLTMFQLTEV